MAIQDIYPTALRLLADAPVQLSQALGAGGLVNPTFAAWLPNMVFGMAALVLLGRART